MFSQDKQSSEHTPASYAPPSRGHSLPRRGSHLETTPEPAQRAAGPWPGQGAMASEDFSVWEKPLSPNEKGYTGQG